MALSLEQQKALAALPPPASLERITQFLSDLGTQGSTPLGETGRAAQNFAASLGGAQSFSARQTSGWVAILMDRYQIKMLEIQDFALWFVRRQEIFAEASETIERVLELAERAPKPVLARLPASAVRIGAMAAVAVASPSAAQAALPAGPGALASISESVSVLNTEAPRKSLRRLPIAPPTDTAAAASEASSQKTASQKTASEETAPQEFAPQEFAPQEFAPQDVPIDPPAPRRLTALPVGGALRLRRIERTSSLSVPEPADAPSEPLAEGGPLTSEDTPPPAKRSLRLTPQMITRPAFVTNIGLAGLLTGISLTPAQAEPLLASPTMNLVSPLLPNIGPTLGVPSSPLAAAPLGTPAFVPAVTPMSVPAASFSVPPALGQVPTLGMPSSLGMLPSLGQAASPNDPASATAPVFAVVSAPATVLASPAEVRPLISPTQSESFSVGTVPADSPPQAAEGTPAVKKAPLLLGLAAGSAALLAASNLFGPQATGTQMPESPAAAGPAPPLGIALPIGQTRLGVSGFRRQIPVGTSDPADAPSTDALPNAALPNAALSPMTLFTGQAASALRGANAGDASSPPQPPVAVTPEMGQITLIAPPLQVASAEAERSGVVASLDWKTLAGGAGPLDEGSLARLKPALPASAGLLYPALPPGRLGAGAVNLPLSAPLVQSLLQKSYGAASVGLASRAADLGSAASGGAPAAMPLAAQIVPGKRPMGASAGVLGHPDEQKGGAGALAEAGQGQAKRGGVMDFLGLPVRLAPSLSGGPELARETAVRTAGQGPVRSQQTLRPELFAPLRNRLFPAFHSMTAEPNEAAWRQAAPSFRLRDGKPTTVLSPDARVPIQTPTSPHPASVSQPSASTHPLSLIPRPLSGFLGSPLPSGVSQALGHSGNGGGFGNIAAGLGQARPRSNNRGLGGIVSGVSQALGHSGGNGFGGIPSGISQALGHSGDNGFGGIPSGISQALGHSGGNGFGNIASGLSQARPRSGGHGFGNIAAGLGQARPRSDNRGFGGVPSGISQALGHSGGNGFGGIPSGISQVRPRSGGHGFGNIAAGLGQARPRSGNRGLDGIPSGLSQALGHSGSGFGPIGSIASGASQAVRHPSFKTGHAGFTSAGSAKPHVNLAAPRTASSRFVPSQIVHPNSRVVNFGPAVKSAGSVPAISVPAMRFVTPRSSTRSASDSVPPMTIQRSETTTTVTPARNEGAKTQARATAGPQGGAASSEVNALAGEVWSLLKRRLANEAERRGRW